MEPLLALESDIDIALAPLAVLTHPEVKELARRRK